MHSIVPFASVVACRSFENRGKGQEKRAGAESRSGVPPLSGRNAVRLAREARRRKSNIHSPIFIARGVRQNMVTPLKMSKPHP